MIVAVHLRQESLETCHIDLEIGVGRQVDGIAGDLEKEASQAGLERRESAPERPARARLVVRFPQKRSQGITAMRTSGDGEVRQERSCFARIDHKWPAVETDVGSAEQMDREVGHGVQDCTD